MTELYASDISVYQGVTNYPLLSSKTAGVILRASIGVQEDMLFDQHWAGLTQQGRPVGAYHYFISYLNGVYQAEAMLAVLGNRVPQVWKPGTGWIKGVVVDCESNTGLTPSALAARIKAFILTIKAEHPDWVVVVYTRGYWWNENLGTAELAFFATLLLWVARYSATAQHPWDNNPFSPLRPLPWQTWAAWQWEADGNNKGEEYGVSSDDIDLDRLRLAPIIPPPDPIPPDPDPTPIPPGDKIGKAIVAANFRAYPVVHDCTYQRKLVIGETLVILGERNGFCFNDWLNVRDAAGVKGWCIASAVEVE